MGSIGLSILDLRKSEHVMMLEMKKKGLISEEDASLLLQRYTATTILALLQEVAQFAGPKVDWNVLVKKTSTGISNAREYQMLWRHLAYRTALAEKLEDDAEPMDDDSDLEFEVEASPTPSNEALAEATACVKVLIASSDPGPSNRTIIEAPLTINVPNNAQTLPAQSENRNSSCTGQGTNITVPVSVQKQPLPTVTSAEGLNSNGVAGLPRRKRKPWTSEEDKELIAAVQKCGEGNWANILKGDFKHDRTASQLSQRWSIIKKKQANSDSKVGGSSNSSALTEAQQATRQAVSIALNMPISSNTLSSGGSGTFSSIVRPPAPLFSQVPQQGPDQAHRGPSKARPPAKKATPTQGQAQMKPTNGPNPLVQAAAVAAGARIAPASTVASLLKAAQSGNVVHFGPPKPLAGPSGPVKLSGTRPASGINGTTMFTGPRPANVHYITTSDNPTPPVYTGMTPTFQRPNGSGRGRTQTRPMNADMGPVGLGSARMVSIGSSSTSGVGEGVKGEECVKVGLAEELKETPTEKNQSMIESTSMESSGDLERDLTKEQIQPAIQNVGMGNNSGIAEIDLAKEKSTLAIKVLVAEENSGNVERGSGQVQSQPLIENAGDTEREKPDMVIEQNQVVKRLRTEKSGSVESGKIDCVDSGG
ncbi:uncharacterized protein LOC18434619 isoform X1 [Amborella trichopoda]|uniref:uncharacterized protein LOC18434619 isoform X1 n=1 Tax=Amborella trichopoda TaxID=13333 RepID=UPI0005D3BDC7|nr:uncharacterized protein LOC18434619 isoform X1 [Amborella trichopoda]XP_020522963.1 uncharacterized protein LOC18434619 isoform X1 [Amborella trichopoda]XP_020522964.1 uncharacterized protein LOC18434619 isoform X1 [Amborella trichopoda]|eukprot:XP_011623501.1 uncharacterized protein LOC18434619 isoform X1 [Amborella trichopoda]